MKKKDTLQILDRIGQRLLDCAKMLQKEGPNVLEVVFILGQLHNLTQRCMDLQEETETTDPLSTFKKN